MNALCRTFLALTALIALVAPSFASESKTEATAPAAKADRVIIIGVDGGDGRTVEGFMADGILPNMSRLREMGGFSWLGTSLPAESPTAWASLNTGRNPAETGVPGFVKNTRSGGLPSPGVGHFVSETGKIEDFPSAPAVSSGDPLKWQLIIGMGAFVAFLVLLKLILKMNTAAALLISVVLGGVGAVAGGKSNAYFPETYPRLGNPLKVQNFWDIAGEAGIQSVILDSAQSFDTESPEGVNVLHGLGIPDARGGIGTWNIYTTEETVFDRVPEGVSTGTAGKIYRMDWKNDVIRTKYYGPRNFGLKQELEGKIKVLEDRMNDATLGYKESQAVRKELRPEKDALAKELAENHDIKYGIAHDLVVKPKGDKYEISIGDKTQTLAVGDWSEFYELTFEINPFLKVHGITRAKLVKAEPHFELFINTLDIDPAAPPFWQEVTSPASYSRELATGNSFETYGWACMTMPFKDGKITPELLLEDIEFTFKWREKMTMEQLARDDWQLFMSIFSTPDRVQHMLYQFYDKGHPMYDEEQANRETVFFGETIKLSEAIPAIFRQVDRVVGRVLDEVFKEGDVMLMCADHGFQTFRYQVNLNNMLEEIGFLTMKDGAKTSDASSPSRYADWEKTRAYSLGLGFVYLNLRGREKYGIVDPADVQSTLDELKAAMLDWRDPATGEPVIEDVYQVDQIHSGEYLSEESELIVGFKPTYRVSWRSTGGKMRIDSSPDGAVVGPVVEDNDSPWSGGHPSVAEKHVRGLFFSSLPVELPEGGPNLLHIAPTVLSLLGVPIPAEMDNQPMTFK
ncbi:MAG: alkaline phosphatase family protein [Planctomycetota bacterium]|nr:alkaline phosphatase family protein [Planctomycetota bacterium]